MAIIRCQTGKEITITEAVKYLERRYDIPAKDIRSIAVDGEVGGPILITVGVWQQVEPDPAELLPQTLNHDGSDRWTGGDQKDAP